MPSNYSRKDFQNRGGKKKKSTWQLPVYEQARRWGVAVTQLVCGAASRAPILHPQPLPTSPTCPWFSQSWQASTHPSKPSSHITSSETFLIPSAKENPSLTPLFLQSSLFRALFRALRQEPLSPQGDWVPLKTRRLFPRRKPTSFQQASVSPRRSAGPPPRHWPGLCAHGPCCQVGNSGGP